MCRLRGLGLGWGIVGIERGLVRERWVSVLADLKIKLYLEVVCLRMLLGGSTSWHTVGQGRRREGEVAGKVGRTTVVDPSEPWDFRLIEKR